MGDTEGEGGQFTGHIHEIEYSALKGCYARQALATGSSGAR